MIDKFHGEHRWLSNFWPAPVYWAGLLHKTVEHAYQAAKSTDDNERAIIWIAATPGVAKKLGKKLKHVDPNWDNRKRAVMENLLVQKFSKDPLRQMLLDTGTEELVEGNTWGDTFWGVCDGVGENHLGKLLMKIRNEIRKEVRNSTRGE